MRRIKCSLSERSYTVCVGAGILKDVGQLIKKYTASEKIFVVTNRKIQKLYYTDLCKSLRRSGYSVSVYCVPDSETAKTQEHLFKLIQAMTRAGCDRHSTVLALGGGVVGDLAGFAASIYMRGVAFINVPTTLLAQVDSAIGGKTAINLKEGKNLIGTFYQPRMVISDIATLKTLPNKEFHDSLAEVIKYGVITDAPFFKYLERSLNILCDRDMKTLQKVVSQCAAHKVRVVEEDEQERTGLRAILNFGHTFAHGFEAAGAYTRIKHGQAVALGMVAASRLAYALDLLTENERIRIEKLIYRAGLMKSLKPFSVNVQKAFSCMYLDKKNKANKITLVLPVAIGKVILCDDIKPQYIQKTIETLC